MAKVTSRFILGLIGSLSLASKSSAKQINIHFENQESFYTSPVVYLTGNEGQNPKVAIKNGTPTTAGVDAKEDNFTNFSSVLFNITNESANTKLKIVSFSSEKDPFCNQLNLSIHSFSDGNKILFPALFPKLKTSTSCHFKIVSLNDAKNEVTENKVTFIFNYTLVDWLGDLGKGTKAQNTAEIIKKTNPNSTIIRFDDKNISDISPLMGFIYAQALTLPNNQIKVIPDAIKNLTHLEYLDFNMNQIEGIPSNIGNLTNLRYLLLSYNQIEIVPNSIGNLTNLKSLILNDNLIEDFPNSFGNLTSLQYLDFNNNYIEVIPDSIGNLSNLEFLLLSINQIEVIPSTIGNLINLKNLSFSDNLIVVIPDSIGNLTNLQYLILPFNQIEFIPDSIENLTNLKSLILSENQIEVIPYSIGNLSNLQSLILNSNQIKFIPESIGNLSNLQSLLLNDNQIWDIPISITNLSSLQQIYFQNNQIHSMNKNLYEWLMDKMADLFNNPGIDHDFRNEARVFETDSEYAWLPNEVIP